MIYGLHNSESPSGDRGNGPETQPPVLNETNVTPKPMNVPKGAPHHFKARKKSAHE